MVFFLTVRARLGAVLPCMGCHAQATAREALVGQAACANVITILVSHQSEHW